MEENSNKENYSRVDTVNMIELLHVLKKRKELIISITILMTIFSYIYVNFIAKPIYTGSTTIEIGQVVNKDKGKVNIINLEEVPVLMALLETKFGVSVSALNNSILLRYSLIAKDKNYIKERLNEAIKFTLDRDKKRVKLYAGSNANIINSSIIVPVSVSSNPIKPKKQLIIIVSFITGLLVSVFLAFFLEFLSEAKRKIV